MKLAAIGYRKGEHADTLLADVVTALRRQNVSVYGTLQHWLCIPDDPCAMALEILPTGERFSLSQDLGRHAQSCRLDPTALALAAARVRTILSEHPRPDLVLFSKFGEMEAQGEGFCDEIVYALDLGLPVLTAVAEVWLSAWQQFTGGFAETLPFAFDAVLDWCHRAGVCAQVR